MLTQFQTTNVRKTLLTVFRTPETETYSKIITDTACYAINYISFFNSQYENRFNK